MRLASGAGSQERAGRSFRTHQAPAPGRIPVPARSRSQESPTVDRGPSTCVRTTHWPSGILPWMISMWKNGQGRSANGPLRMPVSNAKNCPQNDDFKKKKSPLQNIRGTPADSLRGTVLCPNQRLNERRKPAKGRAPEGNSKEYGNGFLGRRAEKSKGAFSLTERSGFRHVGPAPIHAAFVAFGALFPGGRPSRPPGAPVLEAGPSSWPLNFTPGQARARWGRHFRVESDLSAQEARPSRTGPNLPDFHVR